MWKPRGCGRNGPIDRCCRAWLCGGGLQSRRRCWRWSQWRFPCPAARTCSDGSLFHGQLQPRLSHQEPPRLKSSIPKIHILHRKSLTLSQAVALHIAVVVLAGPHESSVGLDHVGDHIVDESVLIPDLLGFVLGLVFLLVDFLEDVLEPAVVGLQDGVLGGEVERVLAGKCELEAAVSEFLDTFVGVVHGKTDTALSFVLVHLHLLLSAVISAEDDLEGSRLVDGEISGFVLISKGVSADDDGLLPSGDESGDILDDDGFSEDSAVEDVSDGAVRALPHLLESELLHSGLIGSDGGALDAYFALLDGFGSVDSHLVVGGITVFDAEVEVEDVEVEEGQDELVLDGLPDDSGHLVAVQLGHGLGYLDLGELHKICCINNCGCYNPDKTIRRRKIGAQLWLGYMILFQILAGNCVWEDQKWQSRMMDNMVQQATVNPLKLTVTFNRRNGRSKRVDSIKKRPEQHDTPHRI